MARTIRGRADLMAAYSGYDNIIGLRSADKLVVYHAGTREDLGGTAP